MMMLTIINTRTSPLQFLLNNHIVKVIEIPLLATESIILPVEQKKYYQQRDQYDYWLFTSPNAVKHAQQHLFAWCKPCFAIGAATAAHLIQQGVKEIIVADPPYTSEAFLSTPAIMEKAKISGSCLIITGKNGRGTLPIGMRAMGFDVAVLEIYKRILLTIQWNKITPLMSDSRAVIIILTSQETIKHWFDSAFNAAIDLKNCYYLVGSLRLAMYVRQYAVENIMIAPSAYERHLHDYLQQLLFEINDLDSLRESLKRQSESWRDRI